MRATPRAELCAQHAAKLTDYLAVKPHSVAQAAIGSALEQALWDIQGKRLGCNVATLMAKELREQIPLYANINRSIVDRSDVGFTRAGGKAVAAGFRRIKIAPFDGLTPENSCTALGRQLIEQGLARVAALHSVVAAETELYVDCHWRLDPDSAQGVIVALSQLGVSWFECPLPETPENIPALKKLRHTANNYGMRLAGLEELTDPSDVIPWLVAGVYDVVMPDVKYAGGISAVIRIAEMSAGYGVGCAPHNPGGPVSHAASLIACAVSENIEQLEHQFDETPAFWQMIENRFPRPENGLSQRPGAAGLGISLRPHIA